MDEETINRVARLYSKICAAILKVKVIRIDDAAKIIENIQRDLNIAQMNELSIIFDLIALSTKDVLEAVKTRWNFHKYSLGLVGEYCMPVDPYYLVYKAEESGYHPQEILARRSINDYIPKHVAEMTVQSLDKYQNR